MTTVAMPTKDFTLVARDEEIRDSDGQPTAIWDSTDQAASLMDPAPNLRDRNLRIFSAIILLAVEGNILSRPAAT